MASPRTASPTSLWTRQFLLVLSLNSVFAIGFNALVPLLPLYLASFHASDSDIGLVVGIFGLGALLFRPLSGQLVDRFGARRVSIVGALLFVVTTPLMAFTTLVPALIALRLVQATGLVSFWTASTALGMGTAQATRMGVAMGFLGMTGPFGGLVASPIAVPAADLLGWQGAFIAMGLMALVAVAMCLAVGVAPRGPRTPVRRSLVNRAALTPALFFWSWALTQGPILGFAPLLALDRNLGNPGLFFAVFSLSNTIFRPAIGIAVDRWGPPVVALPSLLVSAVGIAMIGLADTQGWFLVWAFIYGLANGGIYTSLMTLAIDRSPGNERGSAIATFQWGWDMGMSISSTVLGTVTGLLGYGGIFVVSAVAPIIGSGLFTWSWRTRRLYVPARAAAIE